MTIPAGKERAYVLFLSLLRAGVIHIAFCLVALVSIGFGHILALTLGLATIAVGTFAVGIDLARRASFRLSLSLLAAALVMTAVNVA
jgi:hypothetical protein